ncbi:uncharacterized protein LOC123564896 isoform X2 [Mercenaria mercenaria]|uniref:uncharacterized protein LOC123564896 isoform X2 n=1 Tax=Mercenaria mercenaria TaxID=6596 RepID=UPI00234E3E27|nr:uncharacterized protein LOC123564896 isoform X2 [Mercenaria mercenaria]
MTLFTYGFTDMEDIEHILTCSICIELFEKPRLLPCAHTFCEKCLSDYINSNTKNKPKTKPSFVCPLCRANTALSKQPFNGEVFPANLTIQSLLDSKELMKTIKKKKLPKDIGTASGVMSKIKKKLFTRSKATQTDNEERVRQTTTIRFANPPKKMNLKENRLVLMENDFCSQYFTFHNVPNLYQLALQKLIGPLFLIESHRLRKVMTMLLCIFSVMMYLLLGLFSIVFEWESILIDISVLSILMQVVFVRLKCDVTMIKKRIYALAGFSIAYVVTVYILCILFLGLAVYVCEFVQYQKHGFHHVEKAVFFDGRRLGNVQVREFNTTLDIDNETKIRELGELLADFVVYTNAMSREFYVDFYRFIQQQWYVVLGLFTLANLVLSCVESLWSFIGQWMNQQGRRNNMHVVHARRRR